MSDKSIKLTRRRLLGGAATIGAASAAVGAGTFAAFSDEEESTGNTIQAGTLTLESASNGDIDVSNVVPGWGPHEYTITSGYAGSSTIDPVDLSLDISLEENDVDGGDLSAAEFGQKIEVTTATLEIGSDGENFDILDEYSQRETGHPGDAQYYDLDQVAGSYDDLPPVSPGDDLTLTLELSMPSGVGNDAQGEGVDITVTFTADQPTN